MKKISLKGLHFHLDIERVPTVTLYAALGLAVLCLLGAGWFTYKRVYVPYMNDTIPEEKLTQKQDKLNVRDFDAVSAKLELKQKVSPTAGTVDPFTARTP